MKLFFSILFFLAFHSVFSQAPEFLWAKSVGGTSISASQGIALDNSGNVFSCGYYVGNNDFDPGLAIYSLVSHGHEDAYVLKFDKDGNFIWALNFGDTMNDRAYSVVLDKEGNLLVCGTFQGTIDLDPGIAEQKLSATGSEDAFVLKLSTEGKFISAIHLGGTGSVVCKSIGIDEKGNGLLTGYFSESGFTASGSNTMAIGSNQTGAYVTSSFICKLTANGEIVWIKQIESSKGNCIKSDQQGSVYIGGTFLYVVDFNPGEGDSLLYGFGNESAYVLKLSAEGNFEWVNQLTSNQLSNCSAIEVKKNGQLFATGTVLLPEIVDQHYSYFQECFVLSLNVEGKIVWYKKIGGKRNDYGYGLALNRMGDIFITGCFQDSVDFDPGEGISLSVAKSPSDIFILKLDSSANYIWKGTIIGTVFDGSFLGISVANYTSGISVFVDNKDNVHFSGRYHRYTDFDVGDKEFHMSPLGYGDAYYLKIGKVDEKLPDDMLGLGVFPNPCSKEVYITDGAIGSMIEVFDVNGKLVHKSGIEGKRKVVNVETWSEGLYFMRRVKNDQSIITLKILKL